MLGFRLGFQYRIIVNEVFKIQVSRVKILCEEVDGFIPRLNRLSDNSISDQKHVKNKVSEAFKSKKKEFVYYSE